MRYGQMAPPPYRTVKIKREGQKEYMIGYLVYSEDVDPEGCDYWAFDDKDYLIEANINDEWFEL